jgi:hypothetical protein
VSATAFTAVLVLASAPAWGQFAQYTSPGELALEPEDVRENLDRAVEEARWRLGGLRLSPWFGLRDAGVQDNIFSSEGSGETDVTATVGAGLKAYLPLGRKATFAAHGLPEYVWWRDSSERSEVNGRYGVGLFAFFNRLTVQGTATRREEQGFFSSEVLERTEGRSDRLSAAVEIDVGAAVALFAASSRTELSFADGLDRPAAPLFSILSREEEVSRFGVAYKLPDRLRLGAGLETSRVSFDNPLFDRSNSGTAPIVEAAFEGRDLRLSADLALRSLSADGGSGFVDYDELTGEVQLSFLPGWRVSFTVYANRDLVYTLSPDHSYFEDDRVGLSMAARLGRRSAWSVFGESGDHAYTLLRAGAPTRTDDVVSLGSTLDFRLGGRLNWTLRYTRTEFDSNLAGFDRNVNFLSTGLQIGGTRSVWW